jgi:hypothetical protein
MTHLFFHTGLPVVILLIALGVAIFVSMRPTRDALRARPWAVTRFDPWDYDAAKSALWAGRLARRCVVYAQMGRAVERIRWEWPS